MKAKALLSILFIASHFFLGAQNEGQKTMTSFLPKSNAYDIYYPKDFQLFEDEDGIVTITDTLSGLNFTISSYVLAKKPTDLDLITLLNAFMNDTYNKQHKIEDWNSYKTKFDNLVELETNFDNSNWIWYGISRKKAVVILSINKVSEISEEERTILKFMLDNLIIN